MSATILVVEDNPDSRKLVAWLLEDGGFAAECVGSGEEALEAVARRPFDLILMDVGLPGIDGKEATRRLRARPGGDLLPIVAVTAHAIRGEDEAILASGVSALVTKPVDEDALLRTIRRFLPGPAAGAGRSAAGH